VIAAEFSYLFGRNNVCKNFIHLHRMSSLHFRPLWAWLFSLPVLWLHQAITDTVDMVDITADMGDIMVDTSVDTASEVTMVAMD